MSDQASSIWLAHDTIPSTAVDYTTVSVAELVDACARQQPAAWQEFLRRFHRIISLTALRIARRWGETSPQVVDDLAQETYLKLCSGGGRVLREFRSDHPDAIFGFLKVVTASVANDHFKARSAGKRGGSRAPEAMEGAEAGAVAEPPGSLSPPERALLLDQVDACLRAVAPPETRDRDQTIFWLYYRQGLTAKQIADLPSIGLTAKGVESTLHRLAQLVRARLAEGQKTSGAGTGE
jgi:RNA polymerase sigma-70 factor (ECF subfamily)